MKNKSIIHVCYVINDNPDFVSLTIKSAKHLRMFFRSKDYNLKIYALSETEVKLPEFIENIISPYKDVPLLWQRMYIPEVINSDKVIFLDSDTLAYTCISKLWEVDIGNNVIALAPHYCMHSIEDMLNHYSLKNYPLYNEKKNIKRYFNCGVSIINSKLWRDENIKNIPLTYYDHIKDTPHWRNDEPTYNVCFSNRIFELDKSWNYYPINDYKKANIIHYYGTYIKGKPFHNEFAIHPD